MSIDFVFDLIRFFIFILITLAIPAHGQGPSWERTMVVFALPETSIKGVAGNGK